MTPSVRHTPRPRAWRAAAAGFLVLSALAGCGRSPTAVQATIIVDKGTNPNEENIPSPIVVRLDLLRNADTYNGAEFTPLYTQSKTVLAADLISSNEVELRPGDFRTIIIDDAKDANFLGVLAAFRNIQAAKWRAVYDLSPGDNNKVTITVGIASVDAAKTRRGGWW